jgi:hypothetical protein
MIRKGPFLYSDDKKPVFSDRTEPFAEFETPSELLIPDELRPQAMYIAGNPGYGKSSLIQNMVLSDIAAGHGVCVVDPSGTLIRKAEEQSGIIDWIPERRIRDVIYFNTTDCVRSFDFFSYQNDEDKTVLLDELVALFKLENAPRAKPLLWKILNILLIANHNGGDYVFTDIQTFVEDPTKQREMLKKAGLEWSPVPKPSEFEAVTTRLIPFADDKVMRKVIASAKPEINIWDVMQGNKILLVDLNDTERDYFIGSLIIAKIQQATFRRRIIPEKLLKPFFLYVDEISPDHRPKY